MNNEEWWKNYSLFIIHYSIFNKQKKSGGLAQLGERLPCKQEVSGSIPLISTKEIDWNILLESKETERVFHWVSWEGLERVLKRDSDAPWKLNIVIMMQLWEGNSKENVLQMHLKESARVKITIFAKQES